MIALLVLAGCLGAVPRVSPEAVLALDEPGVDVATLKADRQLFVRSCGGCHALVVPEAFSLEVWPAVITEMSDEAGLSPEEEDRVLRYLRAVLDDGAPGTHPDG